MQDLSFAQTMLYALLALIIGAALCFGGYRFARILFPIWGFFAGFQWGATAITQIFGGGFLATTTGWVVGLVTGLILAALAYFVYQLAVLILAASVGYYLGAGLLTAINIDSALLLFMAGIVVALAFAAAVVLFRLPKVFLILLTALGGAATIVYGILLLFGQVGLSGLEFGAVGAIIRHSWLWFLIYLGVVVAGVIAQVRLNQAYEIEEWSYQQTTTSEAV